MPVAQIRLPNIAHDRPGPSTALALVTLAVGMCLALDAGPARAQAVDPDLWVTDGPVNVVVPDGNKIYIGGSFKIVGPSAGSEAVLDTVGGRMVQRLPWVDGQVWVAVPDGSGGWYIGGYFSAVGGVPRSNAARILADGIVGAWNPASSAGVHALAVGAGVVYAGGRFDNIGGQPRKYLAALDATTGTALPWNPSPNWNVNALAVSGNTVFVAGEFNVFGGTGGVVRNSVAAVDATSGAVTAWNPNVIQGVTTLVVKGNTVYVGGDFQSIGGQSRRYLAAIDATTGAATSWNPMAQSSVYALAVDESTVYAGGPFLTIGGQSRRFIAALDRTTGLATGWNPTSDQFVHSLAIRGSTIYAGGEFTVIGGQTRSRIAALDVATGAATAWNPNAGGGPFPFVRTIAMSGGGIYAGGQFTTIGGFTRNCIAALDAGSGVATGWNPNASSAVHALQVSGGTIYTGGDFTTIGGQARNYVAALDAGNGAAMSWNPNASGVVRTLLLSGQKIYAGGCFSTIGGQFRIGLAALDVATGAATPWHPSTVCGINALALSGSSIIVGGSFQTMGGQTRFNLAAVDTATGNATAWNPNPNGAVHGLVVANSLVYVGGGFTSIGGQLRGRLAALGLGSGTATDWNPNASGTVRTLLVSGNRVYAGGEFLNMYTPAGGPRAYIAALDLATGYTVPWDPGADGVVHALAVRGTEVYAGGAFTRMSGQPQAGVAAIFDDIPTPVQVSMVSATAHPDRIELVWEVGGTPGGRVTVYRSDAVGDWRAVGTATPDGMDRITFIDEDVIPGSRYGYRLGVFDGGVETFAGETWIDLPAYRLALAGARPNPANRRMSTEFELPASGPAVLEVLDVSGRRLVARDVGALGAGAHVLDLTPDRPLSPGLYWLRLTHAGRTLTAKAIVLK